MESSDSTTLLSHWHLISGKGTAQTQGASAHRSKREASRQDLHPKQTLPPNSWSQELCNLPPYFPRSFWNHQQNIIYECFVFVFFFIQEAAVQNKCPLGWGAGSQGRRDSRMGVTCAALKHRRGKAPHAARAVRAGHLMWFIFHFPYCSGYKPVSLLPACLHCLSATRCKIPLFCLIESGTTTPKSRPGSFAQFHSLRALGASSLEGIIGGPCYIIQGSSDLAPLTFGAA